MGWIGWAIIFGVAWFFYYGVDIIPKRQDDRRRDKQRKQEWDNRMCPHEVPGGETRNLCKICVERRAKRIHEGLRWSELSDQAKKRDNWQCAECRWPNRLAKSGGQEEHCPACHVRIPIRDLQTLLREGAPCKCGTCGVTIYAKRNLPQPSELHAHHIIHKSSGGPDTLDNLVTLCNRCHAAKHPHMQQGGKGVKLWVSHCD